MSSGPAHILQSARTFDNIRYMSGIAGDQLPNLILFTIPCLKRGSLFGLFLANSTGQAFLTPVEAFHIGKQFYILGGVHNIMNQMVSESWCPPIDEPKSFF